MEITFHRTNRTTIVTWILGIAFLAIDRSVGINFFYVQYYLFFVGFISIFLSRNKYAVANENGLTIYLGPLFRKMPLLLQWSEINSLQISSADIDWMQTLGGRVQAPAKMNVSVRALKISLKEALSFDLQGQIKKFLTKCLFPPVEAISDSGDEIYLKEPPSGGFKKFIMKLSAFKDFPG